MMHALPAIIALWYAARLAVLVLTVAARAERDEQAFLRAVVKWSEIVYDGNGKPALTQEFFGERRERLESEPKSWNRHARRAALSNSRRANRRAARAALAKEKRGA